MENVYRTSDLPVAAYLISQGVRLQGLAAKNHQVQEFIFAPRKKSEKAAFDFLSGKGIVEARLYADSLRQAKNLVFAAQREVRSNAR